MPKLGPTTPPGPNVFPHRGLSSTRIRGLSPHLRSLRAPRRWSGGLRPWPPPWPWSPPAVALGLLLGALGEGRPRLRLALGTGVLGGLTTHSTFILESHQLLTSGGDAGHPVLGAVYLVGSMAAGLGAAGLGLWLAGQLHRPGRPDGSILPEVS